MSYWHGFLNFLQHSGWIVQIFIVVLVTLIGHVFSNSFFNKLVKHTSKTKNGWDDALFDALKAPVGVLIWLVGLSFAVQIAHGLDQAAIIMKAIPMIRKLGIIATLTWFLIRYTVNLEQSYIKKYKANDDSPIDETTVHAISKLVRIAIFITASLVVIQSVGISISGLLAAGGIGGIGIALASKELLENYFGGLMLYFDRPFAVGDWINSPDRNIEGTVEYIGWRLTRIRTFDKRPLYVPNNAFSSITVVNPSRMTNRRIKAIVGLRYDDGPVMRVVLKDIESMIQHHPEIDKDVTLMVNFVNFGASTLDIQIYCFTKTTNWAKYLEVQQDVFLKIMDIVASHGAECAFPTNTVHIPNPIESTINTPFQTEAA